MLVSFSLTAYFWLFLGYVLGVMAWATVDTVRHDRRRYSDFSLTKEWLEVVLRRGYDGGYLHLGHEPSGQFMQFRKYIRGKGDYGLELICLGLDWLESTLHEAQSVAERAGLPHRVEQSMIRNGSRNGVVIDFGQNAAAAYEIGASIWTEVFDLALETPYKAIRGGLSVTDELIDRPDHPPPLESIPAAERLREFDARLRKSGESSIASILFAAVLVLVVLISGIGFPIAMLLSRGVAPDWSFQLGTIALGGSTASLAFLVVLILSFWGLVKIKVGKVRKPKKRWERRLLLLGRAIAVGLPFAVILAWSGF